MRGVLNPAWVQVWLPISKPMRCNSATSSQVIKYSASFIHAWQMKKVAPNPHSLSRGAMTSIWDLTASSKVNTTVFGGISPNAETQKATPAASTAKKCFIAAVPSVIKASAVEKKIPRHIPSDSVGQRQTESDLSDYISMGKGRSFRVTGLRGPWKDDDNWRGPALRNCILPTLRL